MSGVEWLPPFGPVFFQASREFQIARFPESILGLGTSCSVRIGESSPNYTMDSTHQKSQPK